MLSKTYSWLRLACIGLAILFSLTGTALAQTHIFVDPGHGGVWPTGKPGCTTYIPAFYESHINLGVGLALRDQHLESSGLWYAYSRLTDTAISNEDRAYHANTLDAECLISIHHNCLENCPDPGYTVVLLSVLPTCLGDSIWTGNTRDTTAVLAQKLGLRLRDFSLIPLNHPDTESNEVLNRAYMPSALTEAVFICDTGWADYFYSDPGAYCDEASEIFAGFMSWRTGQGIGRVDYEYQFKSSSDDLDVEVTVGDGNLPRSYSVPYEGCWQLYEWVELEALSFTLDNQDYTFHHWDWVDWTPDTTLESYYYNPYDFLVDTSWMDSTHAWVAYFTGGLFDVTLISPTSGTTEVMAGQPLEIRWDAPAGARRLLRVRQPNTQGLSTAEQSRRGERCCG